MKKRVKIYLGADHAGFELKEKIKGYLDLKKISYEDLGTFNNNNVDYSDYAIKVGEKVASDKEKMGILICGSGVGMCIAANKVHGIRAVSVYDDYTAKMSREHNDANVICLRGRDFFDEENLRLLNIWLSSAFSGDERHIRRLKKIADYEKGNE